MTDIIENVCRSEGTIMHYEGRPNSYFSNSFTHFQVGQKKSLYPFRDKKTIGSTFSRFNNFTYAPV